MLYHVIALSSNILWNIYIYIYIYIYYTVEGHVKQPKYLWQLKMCFLINIHSNTSSFWLVNLYIYIYIYIYI